MSAVDPDSLLLVGRVGRPHGVRGEVKVVPETDDPERLLDLERIFLGGSPDRSREHAVEGVRLQQTRRGVIVILKVADVDDREAAEALRGQAAFATADDLPPLDEGEFFLHDLLDLDVFTDDGERVGTVREVMETPAHPVLVVARDGAPDVLVPAVEAFLEEIDLGAGRIVIVPVEGLLD